jgi:hypothetical protein
VQVIWSVVFCSPGYMQATFFKKFKMIFVSSKKFWKNCRCVVNDLLYQSVKSQFEKHSILGYTKITKSDKFWRFEKRHCSLLRSTNLLFLHMPEQWVFHIDFLHTSRIIHCLHLEFCFGIFKNFKMLFLNFSKTSYV